GCGLSGIVTTGDLVKATILNAGASERTDIAIRDIMTTEVLTVSPTETITGAAKRMIAMNVHRLVVVDGQGETCRPVGILSMGDIVRGMSQP
ncbi:MAG TPA: CBS domain-containing protein, partial [Anaerolineae bacterium]